MGVSNTRPRCAGPKHSRIEQALRAGAVQAYVDEDGGDQEKHRFEGQVRNRLACGAGRGVGLAAPLKPLCMCIPNPLHKARVVQGQVQAGDVAACLVRGRLTRRPKGRMLRWCMSMRHKRHMHMSLGCGPGVGTVATRSGRRPQHRRSAIECAHKACL